MNRRLLLRNIFPNGGILMPVLLVGLILAAGCTGVFPSEAKIGPPDDHTQLQGGAAHKSDEEHPFTAESGCSASDCHQSDLRGGQVIFEGRRTITPSCYQCHEKKWSGSPLASHAQ